MLQNITYSTGYVMLNIYLDGMDYSLMEFKSQVGDSPISLIIV